MTYAVFPLRIYTVEPLKLVASMNSFREVRASAALYAVANYSDEDLKEIVENTKEFLTSLCNLERLLKSRSRESETAVANCIKATSLARTVLDDNSGDLIHAIIDLATVKRRYMWELVETLMRRSIDTLRDKIVEISKLLLLNNIVIVAEGELNHETLTFTGRVVDVVGWHVNNRSGDDAIRALDMYIGGDNGCWMPPVYGATETVFVISRDEKVFTARTSLASFAERIEGRKFVAAAETGDTCAGTALDPFVLVCLDRP